MTLDDDFRESGRSIPHRRTVLKAMGASSIAGLSGCISAITGGNSGESGDDWSPSVDEWPDYSGQSMRIVTDECSDVFKNVWNDAFNKFEEKTGAKVTLECGSEGQSIQERIIQLIQADDPPELFPTTITQASQLQNQGGIAPVTDLVDTVTERLGSPNEKAFLKVDGEDYTIPFFAIPYTQWYRDDIVDSKPDNWDEIQSWVQEAQGSDEVTNPTLLPSSTHWCSELAAQCFLVPNDATMASRNDNGEIEIVIDKGENRDRWIETVEYRKELQQYSGSGSDIGCSERINALHTESAAHTTYGGARPKIQAIERNRDFHKSIRAAQIPGPDGSGKNFGLYKSLVTFQGANTAMAKTFLNRFIYKKDYYTRYLGIQNAPVYPQQKKDINMRKVLPDSYTKEDIESWKAATEVNPPAQQTSPPNPYVDAIFTTRPGSTAVSLVVNEGMSPADAVDQVAKDAREALEQARL